MRTCSKCKLELPLSSFYKDRSRKNGHYPRCKECQSTYTKAWRKENLDKTRKYFIKNRYGISVEEYNSMLREQMDACSICITVFPGGKRDVFYIDHDHKTGNVRGLLCRNCNLMIGYAKDDTDILREAVRYLERSQP